MEDTSKFAGEDNPTCFPRGVKMKHEKSGSLATPRANTWAASGQPARGPHRTHHDFDFDAGGVIPDAHVGRHGAPARLRPVWTIQLLDQPL